MQLITILLVFSLVACQPTTNEVTQESETLKVGLLVEGNIFDQSWDSLAYQTLLKIERELRSEVDYYELKGEATDQRIEEEATKMIKKGYNIIFGHGAVFQNTFNRMGPKYPDVSFVFFNGVAQGDNVYAVNFAAQSIGFFAGVGAALMSKHHIVGVIAAYPNQLEIAGFEAGVRFINPHIKVISDVVGDWGDREKGKAIAYHLINEGADVLIGFGDAFNIEVINAARENKVYAIGFLTDQSFIARDTVLYSVTQNVESIYLDVVRRAMNRQLNHQPFPILDFGNGGQSLTPFSELVPKQTQDKINETLEKYIRGEIRCCNS